MYVERVFRPCFARLQPSSCHLWSFKIYGSNFLAQHTTPNYTKRSYTQQNPTIISNLSPKVIKKFSPAFFQAILVEEFLSSCTCTNCSVFVYSALQRCTKSPTATTEGRKACVCVVIRDYPCREMVKTGNFLPFCYTTLRTCEAKNGPMQLLLLLLLLFAPQYRVLK